MPTSASPAPTAVAPDFHVKDLTLAEWGRKTIQVDWPVGDYDPFFNVNTPEDLARAEAIVIASVALSR